MRYTNGPDISATLSAGDIQIGAVENKDADLDVRQKVAAATAISEAHNAGAVHDAVLGVTTGAALDADGPGTHQQYLRGMLKVLLVRGAVATIGTPTSVASSATNVTVLAANASRKGATVFNESTAILYLKLGATASLTSYATQVAPSGYYEVPFQYTGIIDGIWAVANGAARVTELT